MGVVQGFLFPEAIRGYKDPRLSPLPASLTDPLLPVILPECFGLYPVWKAQMHIKAMRIDFIGVGFRGLSPVL
jgi:hypothetical protein